MTQNETLWPREGSLVIGGCLPLSGDTPFVSGNAVFKTAAGQLFLARRGVQRLISGPPLSETDWQTLIQTGQAFALKRAFPTRKLPVVWVFRRSFVNREQTIQKIPHHALLHREENEGREVVLMSEKAANYYRRNLASDFFADAWQAAELGQKAMTVYLARVGCLLDPDQSLGKRAQYCAALKWAGKKDHADTLRCAEESVRDKQGLSHFDAQVTIRLNWLEGLPLRRSTG